MLDCCVVATHVSQHNNPTNLSILSMKLSLLSIPVLLVLAAIVVACNRKTATTENAIITSPTQSASSDSGRPSAQEPAKDAYQVAGYQKTACFGKCPVYQVKFFSDGKVTWYGQLNVERQGWHEARVDEKLLREIKDKSHELKFWDLSNNYPIGQRVVDLPSTVTYVRAGDMEKTVVDTHQGPAELLQFEEYLAGIINKLEWRPSGGK